MEPTRGEGGVMDDGRRAGPRRPMVEEVSLFDESGEPIVLETTDVSPRGVFVKSDLLFDPGEELWISMKLPSGPKLVVRGRVIHGHLGGSGQPAGMGISFVDLTAREETSLRHFLHEEKREKNVWQAFLDGVKAGSSDQNSAAA